MKTLPKMSRRGALLSSASALALMAACSSPHVPNSSTAPTLGRGPLQEDLALGVDERAPAELVAAALEAQPDTPDNRDWSHYVTGAAATRGDSVTGLQPDFQNKLYEFFRAADAELGRGLQIFSGFRSVERQTVLWEEAVVKYGSERAARRWVAPPGRSQHNHGNAADLMWNGQRLDSAPKDVREWVRVNAPRFGLTLPMAWEPWHIELAGARRYGT